MNVATRVGSDQDGGQTVPELDQANAVLVTLDGTAQSVGPFPAGAQDLLVTVRGGGPAYLRFDGVATPGTVGAADVSAPCEMWSAGDANFRRLLAGVSTVKVTGASGTVLQIIPLAIVRGFA